MDFLQCIEFDKAQNLISASLEGIVAEAESVPLDDALGRITSEDILSAEDLPPFSRSSVDGYAVRSEDTFGASESAPSQFEIIGEIVMGKEATMTIGPGEAAIIPTGGMIPAGANAVVMLEYTQQPDRLTLLVQKTASPNENIISRGEDIAAGQVAIDRGTRVTPQHIGLLAACGCQQVWVRKKINVALISSGDELVNLHETPSFGQIRDVNSHSLAALLVDMGCIVDRIGIVRDSYEQFFATLSAAVARCHMVVISGGSSVGAKDFTVPALQALATPGILIHGLAIKPGKPTIFAMAGNVPVFGLPGHPVAALTVCSQLVALAVQLMTAGNPKKNSLPIPAVITRNIASSPGRDDFVYVRLSRNGQGYLAEPILGKSGLIRIMTQADGVVRISSEKSGLYEGEQVLVYPSSTGTERSSDGFAEQ